MSNNTTVSKKRQSPTARKLAIATESLENHKSALEKMRQENIQLRQKFDSELAEVKKDRMFWFWLANDFRFHHARLAVAMQTHGADYGEPEEAVKQATLDILLAPSEPHSSLTSNHRHDFSLHRVLYGADPNQNTSAQEARLYRGRPEQVPNEQTSARD